MGPYHDFHLLDNSENNYKKYLAVRSDVKLPDDLIRYMLDTLDWVPTELPRSEKIIPFQGLDTYGSTIIKGESANILCQIISAWINLFSFSPKRLIITGSWTQYYNEDEQPEGEGYYEKLEFDRDQIIRNLKKLTEYAQVVANGEHYILHIGI
jgi:hypothetical protein